MKDRRLVSSLCAAFLSGLRRILGPDLEAAYVYGAVTFPETTYTGDPVFHVIL